LHGFFLLQVEGWQAIESFLAGLFSAELSQALCLGNIWIVRNNRFATCLLVVQASKRAVDQACQLVRSALNGLMQARSMVRHNDGLMVFKARFQDATLVVLTALAAVFVGEVDFDARDLIARVIECVLDNVADVSGQAFAPFDVVVGIDLYLHAFLLW
jgi:hypothetical protein